MPNWDQGHDAPYDNPKDAPPMTTTRTVTDALAPKPSLRMNAYYYAFTFTGVEMIDRILSAVACAGKSYHSTESWCDECEPWEDVHRGNSCADWIQNAASDAAEEWNRRPATLSPAPLEALSSYDMSIHTNPDARAWAKFYVETRAKWEAENPGHCLQRFDDEENMIGWFANAMMAMYDHHRAALSPAPPVATAIPGEVEGLAGQLKFAEQLERYGKMNMPQLFDALDKASIPNRSRD